MIASAPRLRAIVRELIAMVSESPEDAPPVVAELARRAAVIERYVEEVPAAAAVTPQRESDAA